MPNRLAEAHSLYLRKHANNPIDWWPWSDEAIARARQEDKPIFLSIGYSSCHWCTVMEGEAFSDGAIADYMNAYFLPIKVDREERPDLDSIYMQALQMMVGQGGWPLNIFLAPDDLLPFYGGTYFPVQPRYGRPGFLQILQAIRQFYDTQKEKMQSVRDEIYGRLNQMAQFRAETELTPDLLRHGLEYSAAILAAPRTGPSFPMIPHVEAGLHGARFQFPDAKVAAWDVCQQRGLDLALGGIYDHVAGGFHRYTVDPTWTVPHFEKMLYDNGQVVEFLANLWSAGFEEPAFERAIAGTVQWLQREMTAPEGYFYAAQDADSFVSPEEAEPEEGAFYVWDYADLQNLLTAEELAELQEQFTVTEGGNFEGRNVLQRKHPGPLSPSLEQALQKLFRIRYGDEPANVVTFPPARNNEEAKTNPWQGRIPAVTDPKMIVAWNSLMISGLARAAVVFKNAEYLTLADRAANFIVTQQQVDGRLHRLNYEGTVSTIARSEDYALLIKALLDLHQAHQWDFSTRAVADPIDVVNGFNIQPDFQSSAYWLSHALDLQREFDEHLWSSGLGGYFNTDDRADLVVRERSFDDNATPSANGVAIANLIRLFLITEDLRHLDRAEQALRSFSGVMEQSPASCPGLFIALDWYLTQTLVRTQPEYLAAIAPSYLPTAILRLQLDLPPEDAALVCQGLSCKGPAHNLEELQFQLKRSLERLFS